MAKQGKIYYTDRDFTDSQVAEEFSFPCMLILNDNSGNIVKITAYNENATRANVIFGGGNNQIVTIGDIYSDNDEAIIVGLHSSGVNSVIINGSFFSKTSTDIFPYTKPTGENLKVLIVYALPTTQIFYMAEGYEGSEAVEPTLPDGALVVRRIVTSGTGAQIDPPNLDGYKLKEEDNWKTIYASASGISVEYSDNRQNFLIRSNKVYTNPTEINLYGIDFYKDANGRDLEFKIFNLVSNLNVNLMYSETSDTFKGFALLNSGKQLKRGDCVVVKYNSQTDVINILQIGGGGSATGDYIPLSGTEVGKPVTGNIEIDNSKLINIGNGDRNIEFSENNVLSLYNNNSVLFLGDSELGFNTSNCFANYDEDQIQIKYTKYGEIASATFKRNNINLNYDSGYGYSSSVMVYSFQAELNYISGDDYTWLRNSQRGVTIGSTVANAYGILGDKDYSSATTGFADSNRLLFVQRAYLENYLKSNSTDAQTVASPITFSNASLTLTGLTDSTTFTKVLVRNSDNSVKTADTIEIFASDGTTTKFANDSALNAAYPNAVEGFELMCANIITTNFPKGVIYKKMSTGWKAQRIYDLSDV